MTNNSKFFTIRLIILFILSGSRFAFGQQVDSLVSRYLDEVVVKAFSYDRPTQDVPASIGLVDSIQLSRGNNSSLLSGINAIAGVRMEERSPGSYRLAIRGSSLRSPFGVRNVKVYWNNLPLTDAGGNTYLNQLDFNAVGNLELIKGPGSSLYGAGTGGVLLLHGKRTDDGNVLQLTTGIGGYGLQQYNASLLTSNHTLQINHQQSEGFRDHSKMKRSMINWQGSFDVAEKQKLETAFFYTDLFYETPGALTITEFNANPAAARPGADVRDPNVHAKAVWMGINYSIEWKENIKTTNGVYGNFVDFKNPSFRNYERRTELGGGARTVTKIQSQLNTVEINTTVGGEYQSGFIPSKVYNNSRPDSLVLQQDDELTTLTYLVFAQLELKMSRGWHVTMGSSYSTLKYQFIRLSDSPDTNESINYNPEFSPRIALLKKFSSTLSAYASISKGFSPPSYAEVYPSAGTFAKSLQAESGYNYEIGFKGLFLQKKLKLELTGYQFNLDHTIVLRRNVDNAEYFVNAGNTSQRGLEFSSSYNTRFSEVSWNFWTSLAYQHYRFKNYQQDQFIYSGNELTGVPSLIINGGIDVEIKNPFFVKTMISYTDEFPLNDANSVYANSYFLVGSKIGYKVNRLELYVGADNVLDETYSLGNDINAFGGRYYNAAAPRNFYGGVKWNINLP